MSGLRAGSQATLISVCELTWVGPRQAACTVRDGNSPSSDWPIQAGFFLPGSCEHPPRSVWVVLGRFSWITSTSEYFPGGPLDAAKKPEAAAAAQLQAYFPCEERRPFTTDYIYGKNFLIVLPV